MVCSWLSLTIKPPHLPQLRSTQGKPPKSYAGKRKGTCGRFNGKKRQQQNRARNGGRWRDGHSEWWRHIRTLPGPWTLLWPSPKSRAQAPPPHTLISTEHPCPPTRSSRSSQQKKSGQKSLTPLPRCNPIVPRLPPSPYPSWYHGRRERSEVCRVATRFPTEIPPAVAVLSGLTELIWWPLHEDAGQDKVHPSPASC